MSDTFRDEDTPSPASPQAVEPSVRHDEFDDEEKILAGRHDVNMPALLTKDVQGG